MRRVWGWTPASSAATEITQPAFGCGRTMSHPEVLAWRLRRHRRQGLHRLLLLLAQFGRYCHLHAHQQVALALLGLDAAALHPEHPAGAGAGRDLERDGVAVEGGHL